MITSFLRIKKANGGLWSPKLHEAKRFLLFPRTYVEVSQLHYLDHSKCPHPADLKQGFMILDPAGKFL